MDRMLSLGLLATVACAPAGAPTGSLGGDQFGEQSTWAPTFPGGIHVLRGDEALAGDPGIPLVLGPADCGFSVVAPGDVDGDSVPDVAVGCGNGVGDLVYLSGTDLLTGTRTDIATVALPQLIPDRGPVALGDLDGDGRGEVGVEAAYVGVFGPQSDRALVVPGAAAVGAVGATDVGWHIRGSGGNSMVVGRAGDFDGDGAPDIVITSAGQLHVVSGALVAVTPWGGDFYATVAPIETLDVSSLGAVVSVAALGDVDGDGRSDLAVVSSPYNHDPMAMSAAEIRLLSSRTASPTVDELVEITAPVDGGQRAAHVAALGDLDGDGLGEIAVTIMGFGSNQDLRSAVAIVPGAVIPAAGALSAAPFVLVDAPWGTAPTRVEPCDLDGDDLPEVVTAFGIWAGVDLLTPGAPPVVEGYLGIPGPIVCLGDIDGNGTSDLAGGDWFLPD